MHKSSQLKKITIISVLISLSVVLSYFDREISGGIIAIMPIPNLLPPNFKIGLANIVILLLLCNFSVRESLTATLLKAVLAGLLLAEVYTFLVGFSGALLSYAIMLIGSKLIKARNVKSLIFISIMGGISHVIGQMAAFLLFYPQVGVFSLLLFIPSMIILGTVSGAFNGVIVNSVNKHLKLSYIENKKSV